MGLLVSGNALFAQYWTASGNNIYNSLPGMVGIGTAPSYSLDVAGTIHTSYSLLVDNPPNAGWLGANFRGNANQSGTLAVQGNQGNWSAWWISGSQYYMKIGIGGGNETYTGSINVDQSGHVGINTLNTSGYTFNVNGTAVFDQVTVKVFSARRPNSTPWADYVFDNNYNLPSLAYMDAYIKANKHLPGIPTTMEIQKNGLDLAATESKLLEKIEQVMLYTIDLQKQVDTLKNENRQLGSEIARLREAARNSGH